MVYFVDQLHATKNFKNYQEKTETRLKLIKMIYDKYPLQDGSSTAKKLQKNWNDLLYSYENNSSAKEKAKIFGLVKDQYTRVKKFIHYLCGHLEKYSEYIINEFGNDPRKKNLDLFQKDIYHNSYQVAKQEIHRAKVALRKGQYYYSAHLFHRGVRILARTYKKIEWETPAVYIKIADIAK